MYRRLPHTTLISLFFLLFLLPAASTLAQQGEYPALEGVSSTNVVFDFRVSDPEAAMGHLDLIHSMLNEPSMTISGNRPEIAVVFIGPSVKLVSTEEGDEVPAEQQTAIADKIRVMESEGVSFEICMVAAHAHEVSPESILPEVSQVGNGWISLIGYQQQGYAMIADF